MSKRKHYKKSVPKFIKRFKGHGGGTVELFEGANLRYVTKAGSNVGASAKMLQQLNTAGFKTPAIYYSTDKYIEMEYIAGLDMKNFIQNATVDQTNQLIDFVSKYFNYCLDNSVQKNISNEIFKKLESINTLVSFQKVNISIFDLFAELPKTVPCSELLHGDFTLDNIIFYQNDFYLIDANPTPVNSIWYDGNKLRQDLDCLWFIRDVEYKTNYQVVCAEISAQLKKWFTFMRDDSILIFMLLRILPYCKDKKTEEFLIKEINKLC